MNESERLEAILEGMPILRWFETKEEIVTFLNLTIEAVNNSEIKES